MFAAPAIQINLVNEGLWKTLEESNEMIVNKKGRNLFPTLAYTICNLEPTTKYAVSVKIVPRDEFKYRFENGSWMKQSNATEATEDPVRVFMHSDGYKSGMEWMAGTVSFPSLKICNDRSSNEMIVLQPNRRYTPHIDVWQLSSDEQTASSVACYRFESTRFIAVTAYKNKHIAELKSVHNKHASGKRKRSEPSEDENQPKRKKRQAPCVMPNVEYPSAPAPETSQDQHSAQVATNFIRVTSWMTTPFNLTTTPINLTTALFNFSIFERALFS